MKTWIKGVVGASVAVAAVLVLPHSHGTEVHSSSLQDAVSWRLGDPLPVPDSVTTVDGTSYWYRIWEEDMDVAPGPWSAGHGRLVVPIVMGQRVEVVGDGSCQTRMKKSGDVMVSVLDDPNTCFAWWGE